MVSRGVIVVLLAWLLVGCSPDDDPGGDPGGPSSSGPSTSGSAASGSPDGPELKAAWSTELGVTPFSTSPFTESPGPNEGPQTIDAGERTIVLGEQQALGLDTATGSIEWTVQLPAPVCATAPRANDAGTAVLMTGDKDTCTDVVALDSATGTTLWTVPAPRADAAYGHEVSLGPDSVVVTGECAGFTIFRAEDGSTIADVPGRTVGPKCASATGDGTSVVLSSGPRLSVYDAGTGARTSSAKLAELGRVGDVVSSDPLVVSAAVKGEGRLVALGGRAPVVFGRDSDSFGGVPEAATVAGGTLWVQYDGVPELVGYDPAGGAETATIPVDPGADALVGATADRLVVTAGAVVDGTTRTALRLYDPARPDEAQAVGLLPPPREGDRGVSSSQVVGDVLVRIWRGAPEAARAEGIELPTGTSGGSSDDPSSAA